jgi:hypothetical protein
MPVENRQIASGAITDSKVSKNAGIKGSKLEIAEPGQILVANDQGRFVPKHVEFGSGTSKDCCDDALKGSDLEAGKTWVGGDNGVPVQVKVNSGPGSIVVTNEQNRIPPDIDIFVENFVPDPPVTETVYVSDLEQTPSYSTDGSDLNAIPVTQTSQTRMVGYLIFETPDPPGSTKQYQFTHALGYIPDVRVMEHSTNSEIDAEVSVDTQTATVKLSDSGTRLRVLVQ